MRYYKIQVGISKFEMNNECIIQKQSKKLSWGLSSPSLQNPKQS